MPVTKSKKPSDGPSSAERSFRKEPFEWTPPDDDTGVVQDAVTLFERSLSAFVERQLRDIHGDAWLRRGCGGDYKTRWTEREKRAAPPHPATLLGYADISELSEIVRRKDNWAAFEPYFGGKASLEQKFSQILPLRNAAFHSGQRVLYASEEAAAFAAMVWVASCYHITTADAIDNLWTADEPEPSRTRQETDITANLILKNFDDLLPDQPLVGREEELRDIHSFWHDDFARCISITGRGGMGKTALVYQFTNDLLRSPVGPGDRPAIDLVLFVTAKQTWASQDTQEHLPASQRFATLDEAFAATLDLFDERPLSDADFESTRRQVLELASASKCLFVFDNLETLADDEISTVALFCQDLPQPSKAIITDRERRSFGIGRPMKLPPLSDEASLDLVNSRLAAEGVPLSPEGRAALRRVIADIGGLPLHLHYVANLLGQGHTPQEALERLRGEDTLGLLHFSFKSSLDRLSQSALQLLFYLAVKRNPATRKELLRVRTDGSDFKEDMDSLDAAHFVERATGGEAVKFQIADPNLRDYVYREAPKRMEDSVTAQLTQKAGGSSDLRGLPNVQRAIEQAIGEADKKGTWAEAISYLESKRTQLGNPPQLLARLGYLYFRRYDRQTARALLERSRASGWEDVVALRTLGIINLREKRLEEAEENSEAALALRPDDKQTKRLLGEVLLTRAEESRFTLDSARRGQLAERAFDLIDGSLIEDDYASWQQNHNADRRSLLERCERLLPTAAQH